MFRSFRQERKEAKQSLRNTLFSWKKITAEENMTYSSKTNWFHGEYINMWPTLSHVKNSFLILQFSNKQKGWLMTSQGYEKH